MGLAFNLQLFQFLQLREGADIEQPAAAKVARAARAARAAAPAAEPPEPTPTAQHPKYIRHVVFAHNNAG
jgi:hypothetical protein